MSARMISILVADDEIYVRRFLESVITNENLPVSALYQADNGLDAVSLAGKHSPDLVLLDIRMPGLDGLKAAKQILGAGYSGKIVIVSAYSDFEYAREALKMGVSDYMVKPVRPAEFSALISETAQSRQEKTTSPQAPEKARPLLVRSVLAYISENMGGQIKVEDIAKVVHLSPWHLSRTFKRLEGRNLMDCVRDLRIERAKDLLVAGELSVTEISLAVGFEHAGYFATCFKRVTGISPSEYRKKYA